MQGKKGSWMKERRRPMMIKGQKTGWMEVKANARMKGKKYQF